MKSLKNSKCVSNIQNIYYSLLIFIVHLYSLGTSLKLKVSMFSSDNMYFLVQCTHAYLQCWKPIFDIMEVEQKSHGIIG